jgi:hypothetical protein
MEESLFFLLKSFTLYISTIILFLHHYEKKRLLKSWYSIPAESERIKIVTNSLLVKKKKKEKKLLRRSKAFCILPTCNMEVYFFFSFSLSFLFYFFTLKKLIKLNFYFAKLYIFYNTILLHWVHTLLLLFISSSLFVSLANTSQDLLNL